MANGKHDPGRLAAMVVSLAVYVISLVFNGLSVVGVGKSTWSLEAGVDPGSSSRDGDSSFCCEDFSFAFRHLVCTVFLARISQLLPIISLFSPAGPYTTTTANVSAVFDTQLTPSGWTFNIWSVIYVWLTAMVIYILSGLCRKSESNLLFSNVLRTWV